MDDEANFISLAINCITRGIIYLINETNNDIVVQRLESLLLASSSLIIRPQIIIRMESTIEEAITLLETIDQPPCSILTRRRKSIKIDFGAIAVFKLLNNTNSPISWNIDSHYSQKIPQSRPIGKDTCF
jgi:hypothetical protein